MIYRSLYETKHDPQISTSVDYGTGYTTGRYVADVGALLVSTLGSVIVLSACASFYFSHMSLNTADASNELQSLAAESQSLATSHGMVLDILSSGQASLQELQQQRQRLRGATRVVADIGSALGLSQATMRIIERRDITDAYLVAAGMVVTLIVLYITWF
jgi:Snare region anchored in the vesicle membrane C-terminus